jgi:hypothetical protein
MEWTDEQQQEINKLIEAATKPLQKELEKTKVKLPKEPTEDEKALQEKAKSLWKKQVSLTLQENGLGKFDSLISAKDEDDLKTKVESLNKIVSEFKVDHSFKPEEHKHEDAYSQAKKKHDTVSMIKSFFK